MEEVVIAGSADEILESIHNLLSDNIAAFYPAIDFRQVYAIDRAEVDDVTVTSVEWVGDCQVEVFYEIQWSAYYGCKDMNATDVIEDSIIGQLRRGKLIFEKAPVYER